MATLRTDTRSPYYFATWRDAEGKQRTKSTKVRHTPLKTGKGKPESKAQLMARAQLIADAYEEASKTGMEARHVRATLEMLGDAEQKPNVPSVRAFVESWIQERTVLLSKTTGSDKKAIAILEASLGSRFDEPISKISKPDIQAVVNSEVVRVSASTVKRYMQSLSIMFNSAIDHQYLSINPTHKLKYPKGATQDKLTREPFSRDDIRALLEKMPPDWASMVLVSLHLGGQRLGDCALLRWEDVDFKRKSVGIITQKTTRAHAIPMTATLEKHLKQRSETRVGEYVHQDLADRVLRTGSTQHISLEFSTLCEAICISSRAPMRAGERRSFRNKTFHSLRASAVTMLHDAGVPLSMAMLIVGHNNADIHRVYYRPSDEAIRDSLSNLDI